MLLNRTLDLKSLAKIGSVLTLMIAASACSHEQLKDEAQVSAIEDTTSDTGFESPTPDLAAPPTPIPTDDSQSLMAAPAPARHHVKKSFKAKGTHHAKKKSAKKIAKRRRHQKTMVATAGTVDATLPPAPPTEGASAPTSALEVPVPPTPVEATAATADLTTDALAGDDGSDGGSLPLTLVLIAGALGALVFGGLRLRKHRGSRRLVFN